MFLFPNHPLFFIIIIHGVSVLSLTVFVGNPLKNCLFKTVLNHFQLNLMNYYFAYAGPERWPYLP